MGATRSLRSSDAPGQAMEATSGALLEADRRLTDPTRRFQFWRQVLLPRARFASGSARSSRQAAWAAIVQVPIMLQSSMALIMQHRVPYPPNDSMSIAANVECNPGWYNEDLGCVCRMCARARPSRSASTASCRAWWMACTRSAPPSPASRLTSWTSRTPRRVRRHASPDTGMAMLESNNAVHV